MSNFDVLRMNEVDRPSRIFTRHFNWTNPPILIKSVLTSASTWSPCRRAPHRCHATSSFVPIVDLPSKFILRYLKYFHISFLRWKLNYYKLRTMIKNCRGRFENNILNRGGGWEILKVELNFIMIIQFLMRKFLLEYYVKKIIFAV